MIRLHLSEEAKTKYGLLQDMAVSFLEELVEADEGGGWCINVARIRVGEVLLLVDCEGKATWQVSILGGCDGKLCSLIAAKLLPTWGHVDVAMEW
jgi:hypothetical protein